MAMVAGTDAARSPRLMTHSRPTTTQSITPRTPVDPFADGQRMPQPDPRQSKLRSIASEESPALISYTPETGPGAAPWRPGPSSVERSSSRSGHRARGAGPAAGDLDLGLLSRRACPVERPADASGPTRAPIPRDRQLNRARVDGTRRTVGRPVVDRGRHGIGAGPFVLARDVVGLELDEIPSALRLKVRGER